MSKKSFVGGAVILGIAGIITKVIGAFYRIPLTNIIGSDGVGIYQEIYPIYALLLVISTAGIPTGISKLVSAHYAKGDYRGAHRVFRTALVLLLLIGIVLSVAMYFGSGLIASMVGDPQSALAFQYLSPAIFFVAVFSAFRGYFQGQQIMLPTASSQLMEQLGKLTIGLMLAAAWLPWGVEWGAAGTLLGVSFSELAAFLLLICIYVFTMRSRRQRIKKSVYVPRSQQPTFGRLSWNIVAIAIPVTIGAGIMPLMGFIDAVIIGNGLQGIGYSIDSARSLYGLLTGVATTLVAMPSVLASALQMSLVPAISHAKEKRDKTGVRMSSLVGVKLALYISLPCAVGLFALAEPIIRCLYSAGLTPEEITRSAQLLQQLSFSIIFLTLDLTTTGILQGLGKVMVPVFNLFIGAVFKVVISLLLIRIPSINITGAIVGTIACYFISSSLNVWQVSRRTRMPFKFVDCVVKPVIAVAVMGVFAYLFNLWLSPVTGKWVALGAGIGGGVLTYFVMVLILGGLKPEDLDMIPGGGKLKRFVKPRDTKKGRER
ncbi:MAG: putative polysaccharide biosynthesis protein [Bacillota bacterium]